MRRTLLRRRLPALSVVPVLAVGFVGFPATPPTADPRPVRTEVATLPLAGVESATVARAAMPDTPGHHLGGQVRPQAAMAPVATTQPTGTAAFRLVGITWSDERVDAHDVSAWVRTRSDGRWSGWYAMPSGDEHGPDPGSAEDAQVRGGTDPLLVAPSDGVQVRVDSVGGRPLAGLRVDLVDPGTSPADAVVGTATPDAAAAGLARPAILSRADWGADESLRDPGVDYGQIKAGFVHHTVNANDYTAAEVPAIIRAIYRFHVTSRGYKDIGYNFLLDRFGRIWEGRYGGVDKPVIGAHTLGHNDDAFAGSVIGTYTDYAPSSALLDAYARLFAWKFSLHGVDPLSRVNLDGEVVNAISGHRDTYPTACPGDRLYAKLPTIRAATAAVMTAGITRSVTASLRESTIATGSATLLRVRTTGVPTGAVVQLRSPVEGVWTTLASKPVDETGRTFFRLAPTRAGTYDYRARLAAATTVRSAVQRLTVTAVTPDGFIARSTDVFTRPADGVYTITGRGYGHGRGMSQWGAYGAAAAGVKEPAITRFYYPGTTRATSPSSPAVRVLLTADTGADLVVRHEPGLTASLTRADGTSATLELPSQVNGCSAPWWRVYSTGSDVSLDRLCGQGWVTWRPPSAINGDRPVTFRGDGLLDTAQRTTSGFVRKAYRGALEADRVGGALRVVNVVPLEAYLRGVVPNESPASWPAEALKAQAVAARTYAMREARDRAGVFDVYDTTASQVYPGARLYDSSWRVVRSYEDPRTDAAIAATARVHLRYDGIPAFTQFSSSNGGVTAAGNVPYLGRTSDAWDRSRANPHRRWSDSVSVAALQQRYPSLGRLERIRVTQREGLGDWGGRILAMTLVGSSGSVTVTGDSAVRSVLGTKSSYLTFG
jgi:SpoIID/LytB domain protein